MENHLQPIVESKTKHFGFDCYSVFMPLEYRCGYVAIPKTHPLYGEELDKLGYLICHGGVTFSGIGDNLLWWKGEPDEWLIGFDCMHFTDGVDIESFKKYYPNEKTPFILFNQNLKSQIYVEETLQRLAYDLRNIKNKEEINE